MDETSFDAWSRALARSFNSRRNVIQAVVTGGLAVALLVTAGDPTVAKKKRKRKT